MPEVGEQAIRHVNAGAGDATQCLPEGQLRLRALQGGNALTAAWLRQFAAPLKPRQPLRRSAGLAGYPDVVARLGTIAAQGLPGGCFAENGDAQVERATGGVSSDELHPVGLCAGEETCRERGQPRLINCRQRQRQRRPARLAAHGRDVRDIDRQSLPAQIFRVGAG